MEGHVKAVASLQIGLSILGFLFAVVIYAVLNLVGDFVDEREAEIVLTIVANVAAIFLFIVSIPGFIAGLGLFKMKEWARILTLIISVLNLFSFPIGTAVGVYSIWTLSHKDAVPLFRNEPVQPAQ